ncbi:carboxymethylenebutenolidase [Colletotrichum orchidophilum]|uniref:Carboxymethylenebutenolidase n=1 Tax=Colletotrichum orchidophilum TaxID=1209926 RepID=A0A1G4BP48_9PEZI|nr:carboxymethylenebutenolidase [Colletotrichum orchidophilum]OHF03078.1 carboxymethylenebutenolidase [Colletotrichum orchidophilum]
MYADISKLPAPLPQSDLETVASGISLLPPLSRRGVGPGVILLVPSIDKALAIEEGVPSLPLKWAEEGYTVIVIQPAAFENGVRETLDLVMKTFQKSDKCKPKDVVGLVAYEPEMWNMVASILSDFSEIVSTVVYADNSEKSSVSSSPVPAAYHFAGKSEGQPLRSKGRTEYFYSAAKSFKFAIPFQPHFDYNMEMLSYTRNLTLLKGEMKTPIFDLEAIWDEHTWYEFADRSVEHTMSTMVQEPYVNHIPTLTGGVGRVKLTDFYRHNFIFNNSADTELELISRTIGIDRVVDEFIFKFTHDQELDWLLPGVPPTNKYAEIPFAAVVNIRGDRLYHEHITWDQGTALAQLGLLPEYLPFPGGDLQYRVPVAGVETAMKLRARNSVPSNEMFKFTTRSAVDSEGVTRGNLVAAVSENGVEPVTN